MTAKEKLLKEAPAWSEEQAERALRAAHDEPSDDAWLDELEEDDEPLVPGEEAAIEESDAQLATGRASRLADLKQEFGIE